jgi:hypothetical protein
MLRASTSRHHGDVRKGPYNNKMQLTSGGLYGALRAPSLSRRLQLILVFGRLTETAGAIVPTALTTLANCRGLVLGRSRSSG